MQVTKPENYLFYRSGFAYKSRADRNKRRLNTEYILFNSLNNSNYTNKQLSDNEKLKLLI